MQTLRSCTLQSTIKQHVRGTNPAVNHLVSALQRHAAENPQECGLQTWMLWNGSKRKEEKFYLLRSLGKIQTTTSLKKKKKKKPPEELDRSSEAYTYSECSMSSDFGSFKSSIEWFSFWFCSVEIWSQISVLTHRAPGKVKLALVQVIQRQRGQETV